MDRQMRWRAPLIWEFMHVDGLQFLKAISDHHGARPAFPYLRCLTLDVASDLTLRYWKVFASPYLSSVLDNSGSLGATGPPVCATLFLTHIWSRATPIKEISFTRSVTVGSGGFFILSRYDHLKKLRASIVMTNSEVICDNVLSVTELPEGFCELEDLSLDISTVGMPDQFNDRMVPGMIMRHVSSSPLKRLVLNWKGCSPTQDGLRELLASVARFHETLETFELRILPRMELADDETIALSAILPPLLQLAKVLRVLDLSELPLKVDHNSFAALVDACTDLRILRLGQDHSCTTSTVSLTAITRVRARSLRMEELGLPIAPLTTAGTLATYLPGEPHSVLRGFDVGHNDDFDSRDDAWEFVYACFPHAEIRG